MLDLNKIDEYRQFIFNEMIPTDIVFHEVLRQDCVNEIEDSFFSEAVDDVIVGATKVVLVNDNLPFVVKIPLYGIKDKSKNIQTVNYCERESYLYDEACRLKIDNFFAQIISIGLFYGDKDYCDVYISEKMPHMYNIVSHLTRVPSKTLISSKDGLDYEDAQKNNLFNPFYSDGTLAKFYTQYGEDAVERLLSFIDNYAINDLHDGNIGCDDNYYLKLIDYAGYFGLTDISN